MPAAACNAPRTRGGLSRGSRGGPLLSLLVASPGNVVATRERLIPLDGHGQTSVRPPRWPRSTATLDGHARRPRSTATLDGHARRPRSTATLDGHARRPRSTATLSSHARQPRSAATLGSHAQQPRSAATRALSDRGQCPGAPAGTATLGAPAAGRQSSGGRSACRPAHGGVVRHDPCLMISEVWRRAGNRWARRGTAKSPDWGGGVAGLLAPAPGRLPSRSAYRDEASGRATASRGPGWRRGRIGE